MSLPRGTFASIAEINACFSVSYPKLPPSTDKALPPPLGLVNGNSGLSVAVVLMDFSVHAVLPVELACVEDALDGFTLSSSG